MEKPEETTGKEMEDKKFFKELSFLCVSLATCTQYPVCEEETKKGKSEGFKSPVETSWS